MADRIQFVLSDESVNVYGFRILTKGITFSAPKNRTPMFYNHTRGDDVLPIGRWEGLKKKDGKLTGYPVFDEDDDFALKVSGKVEREFLNSTSIGIEILAISEDPKMMLRGQVLPTVTKCEMFEASIVDIPANKGATRLSNNMVVVLNNGQPTENINEVFQNLKSETMSDETPKKTAFQKLLALFVDVANDEGTEELSKEVVDSVEQIKAELSQKDTDLENAKNEIVQLKADKQGLEEKVQTLSSTETEKDTKIAELSKSLEDEKAGAISLKAKFEETEKLLTAETEKVTALTTEKTDLQTKLNDQIERTNKIIEDNKLNVEDSEQAVAVQVEDTSVVEPKFVSKEERAHALINEVYGEPTD